jgi:CBS domain-containing protein
MSQQTLVARDVMVRNLIVLRPDMDVFEAISILLKNKISGAPVVDCKGNYLGVLSEKNCLTVLMTTAFEGLPTSTIRPYIDTDAKTITEDADLFDMTHTFLTENLRRLPVLNANGALVGQVSRRDILRATYDLLGDQQTPTTKTFLFVSTVVERENTIFAS